MPPTQCVDTETVTPVPSFGAAGSDGSALVPVHRSRFDQKATSAAAEMTEPPTALLTAPPPYGMTASVVPWMSRTEIGRAGAHEG